MDFSSMSWSEIERLVGSRSRKFDRIAFGNLKNRKRIAAKLRHAFVTSIKKGESFSQLVARIQKIIGVETRSATRIARTEMTKISNRAQYNAALDCQRDTGAQFVKTWVCTFHNSRDSHIELHNTTIPLGQDFHARGGPMLFPGDDSRVGAEEIVNCMCYLRIESV